MWNRNATLTLITALIPMCAYSQVIFQPALDRGGQIRFGDVPVGDEAGIPIIAQNNGNAMATINLAVNPDVFAIAPNQMQLNGGMAGAFLLTFAPRQVGEVQGSLTGGVFFGNIGLRVGPVTLFGTGIEEQEPPDIYVDPEEILIRIDRDDDPVEFPFVIGNRGEADLFFEIEIDDGELAIELDRNEGMIESGDEIELILTIIDIPHNNGEYVFGLLINSNDPDDPEIHVPGTLIVDVQGIHPQMIELGAGWNLISSARDFSEDFIDHEGPDMRLIFADIMDELVIVKDGQGDFCVPRFNFCGIPFWNTAEGYWVKVENAVDLTLVGEIIPFDRPVPLAPGWQNIAYYPHYPLQFGDAFAVLFEHETLLIAKDGVGRFTVPEFRFGFGYWAFPGTGFQVKMSARDTLIYPDEPDRGAGTTPKRRTGDLIHFPEPPNTGNNMSVLLNGIAGIEVSEGAEIACVTDFGVVAGAEVITELPLGIAVWGDDPFTDEIESFRPGDTLEFLYWDAEHDWELEVHFDVVRGEPVYQTEAFLVLDLVVGAPTDPVPHPTDFVLEGPFPNPFNNSARVQFALPRPADLQVALYDIHGALVKEIINATYAAGTHRIDFAAGSLNSGVYLLTVEAGGWRAARKVVVLK